MKKYPFCFLAAAVFLSISVCTPQVMYASLPKVTYIKAEQKSTEKTVNVNGKIMSDNIAVQTADTKFVVGEVLVNIGDTIKQGERILKIDTEQTQLLCLNEGGYSGETYITAVQSGSVESIFVSKGMTVAENNQLISLIDINSLCAQLSVSEDIISEIKVGQKLTVSGNAFKNKTYDGEIKSIAAVATNDNGSVSVVNVTAKINNPDEKLKPGYSCKAKIVTKKIKNALIIPSQCVAQDDNGEYVYKLNGSKSQKIYVKTGEITKEGTIIKEGIKKDEYIISNPQAVNGNSDVAIKE